MAVNQLPLSAQLRNIAKKQLAKAEKIVQSSLIELGENIRIGTPVDQGRLINNWNTAIGSVDSTVTTSVSFGGTDSARQLEGVAGSLEIGETLYYTNSLPYAARIEYEGHSSEKAPNGMVRINIANWQQIVKSNISRQSKL